MIKHNKSHKILTLTEVLVRLMNSRRLLSSMLSILKRFGFFSTISNQVLSDITQTKIIQCISPYWYFQMQLTV